MRNSERFSGDRLTLPDEGETGERLVFLVGAARSGTTWLQRLLAGHPRIRTGQETHLFEVNIAPQLRDFRILGDPQNRGGVGLACYFSEAEFLEILKSYMMTLLRPMISALQPGEFFLEKTPAHGNYLPEILELLPRARIIHIVRDPRDVVVSQLAAAQTWGAKWFPRRPRGAALQWVRYVRNVRAATRSLPPAQFLEVRYEDLQAAPVDSLMRCAEFLGLAWDRDSLDTVVAANVVSRAKSMGGGTPIPLSGEAAKRSGQYVVEPEDFIRKGKTGDWTRGLGMVDRYRIWRVLRKPMREFGYSWSLFVLNH